MEHLRRIQELKGAELKQYLLANKKALIKEKKSMYVKRDALAVMPSLYMPKKDGQGVAKAEPNAIPADVDSVHVKVIANTALWCDSHMDVLLPDCWEKSIKERKGFIPHLHDHIHKLDAELGIVTDIYSQTMSLSELGINKQGVTQCLIFETDILKSYNQMAFDKYKSGRINQHSIGLWYVQLELAINDESSEKEYDFWKKYVDKVINKELVEEMGFFWVVPEIKLVENSAVLFGANIHTPTLDVKDTLGQPPIGTEPQPSGKTEPGSFDIGNKINNLQIFN